ncbi:hypothetical protein FKP32DRAFT_301840 [Trametes sanguinea]|nr:hypothetical protein FKP32DRAFT_301840 [Trametes sanguinea]
MLVDHAACAMSERAGGQSAGGWDHKGDASRLDACSGMIAGSSSSPSHAYVNLSSARFWESCKRCLRLEPNGQRSRVRGGSSSCWLTVTPIEGSEFRSLLCLLDVHEDESDIVTGEDSDALFVLHRMRSGVYGRGHGRRSANRARRQKSARESEGGGLGGVNDKERIWDAREQSRVYCAESGCRVVLAAREGEEHQENPSRQVLQNDLSSASAVELVTRPELSADNTD